MTESRSTFAQQLSATKAESTLGEQTRQGAIGLVIDRDYLEISFPPSEASDG